MDLLEQKKFKEVDLNDPFFDSLKRDYTEFSKWFKKKAEEPAYVFYTENNNIDGFLYLKEENEALEDLDTPLPAKPRIKIGTFKINPHGTRLGERFIKKSLDYAINKEVEEIYLTIFENHEQLLNLFQKYGFEIATTKTTHNGKELVLIKSLKKIFDDVLKDYPLINLNGHNIYLLAIYPRWHTVLFPDSKLLTEGPDVVQDLSHTNSIHKVYLGAMRGMDTLKKGDVLVIYRTSDQRGPAHYRSVVTSICVFEEYTSLMNFSNKTEFKSYCTPYSVFTDEDLDYFWQSKKYPHIIRFTYNIALKKRLTRGYLINNLGILSDYWGFFSLQKSHVKQIAKAGEVNESLIID